MNFVSILLLAIVQGLAELLPVSSSAHVILAQRLLGLDPGAPAMTFLLVMLHTGTMFAVLLYFWPKWRAIFAGAEAKNFFLRLAQATAVTGILGLGLKFVIEKLILEKALGHSKGEVEELFRWQPLIAVSLFSVGVLIVYAGKKSRENSKDQRKRLSGKQSLWIGFIQGLCLPFRGFSRSGATISTALLLGVPRAFAEEFSFALAILLTPPVILHELKRLMTSVHSSHVALAPLLLPSLGGMVLSFLAGLLALKWLSAWLEEGRWHRFGYYCFAFSALVALVSVLR